MATKRTPRWLNRLGKRVAASPMSAAVLSRLGVWFLECVYWTNRFVVEPDNALDIARKEQPLILAVWHGQHILLPALRINMPASVMISRSLDGEITARIARAYGSKPIRASGGRDHKKSLQKGGMRGFLEMLDALKRGENVVQTADIPKGTPKRVGEGIIKLAAKSGAKIVPLAVASSRRVEFSNAWDNAHLNLPFGKTAICMGAFISVENNANSDTLEKARLELEQELNHITRKANDIVRPGAANARNEDIE